MGESAFYCANHRVSCKCQQPSGRKIHRFFRWKMPFAVFRSGSGVSDKNTSLSKVFLLQSPHNVGYSGLSFLHWPSTMLDFLLFFVLDFLSLRATFRQIFQVQCSEASVHCSIGHPHISDFQRFFAVAFSKSLHFVLGPSKHAMFPMLFLDDVKQIWLDI